MTKESLQDRIDAAVARATIPPEVPAEVRTLAEYARQRIREVRAGKVSKRKAPVVQAAALYLLGEVVVSDELAELISDVSRDLEKPRAAAPSRRKRA